ncbi:MAG: tetratricopeptide repeat protein [Armatimonadota bacterium]
MTRTSRSRGIIAVYGLLAGLLVCSTAIAQDVESDFAQAVTLFQERSYPAAIRLLESVTAAAPDNEAAWYYLGVARFRTGELEGALEALQQTEELRPGRPGVSLYIGQIYEQLGAYDEAVRAYQDELRNRQFANLAEVFNALGRVHYLAGRYQDAIDTLTQALEHYPNYVESYFYRGLAHHARKEYDQALKDFEKALEIVDEWDRLSRRLGRLTEREGTGGLPAAAQRDKQRIQEDLAQEYARAAEFVQELVMRPQLYLAMGDSADAAGRWALARNTYRKALDPDLGGNAADPLPHVKVGEAYFHEAQHTFYEQGLLYSAIATVDTAISNIDEAVKLDATYPPAHLALGDIFFFQAETYVSEPARKIVSHSYEDALARYDEALAGDPECVAAYKGRAEAYMAVGDPDRAIEDLTTALELAPRNAGLYAALAKAYVMLEQYDRAINAAQLALGLDAENAQAHNAAGLAYYYRGELGPASEHFSAAIEADPTLHQPYTNLGNTFFQMGSWHRARAQYEAALKRIPEPAIANTAFQRSYLYYLIGRTYHHAGMYEREIEALNQALALDAAYLDALLQLASAYSELKQYRAADQALRSALSVSPGAEEDAEIYVQMGRLYEREGRPYEAITAYGAALSAQSDNIEAREALQRLTSG